MEHILHLHDPLNKESYRNLPSTNGVYIFRKDEEYLYIGKSVNIKARVLSHVENARYNAKEEAIVTQATSLEINVADSEFTALLMESKLIQSFHPKYNVIWRDDKSYLYIKITKEEYPKIFSVRKELDKKAVYFGPFSSSREVAFLLRAIRKVFPYCAQQKLSKRPCFYSKIGLCNPCPNRIEQIKDTDEKKRLKTEYRSNIRKIVSLLQGKTDRLMKTFQKELRDCIVNSNFEKGIELRQKIATFEYLLRGRSFDHLEHPSFNRSKEGIDAITMMIKRFLPDIKDIHRLECYDVSNLMQKQATASMVVFIDGIADKKEYRRFKIKNTRLQSDFDMLEEVIRRRFTNEWMHPDLIVIDGGRPQMRRVIRTLRSINISIPAIGIAKNPDRIVVGSSSLPTLRPKLDDMGFRLIQEARDESHRFARKYHLLLRNKKLLYNVK